ncbi:MAG: alpha/beta hydrolase [Planctomycetota bacterium]
MKNFHLACLGLTFAASLSCAQVPLPPPNPDVKIDEGVIDVYQGGVRCAVESFTIVRTGNGDIEIHGEATLALPDRAGGSEKWTFYPMVRYGGRGLKLYELRAKYPTGPGTTDVRFDGAQCTWSFQGPNNQQVGPTPVPLPLDGILIDKRIMSHFAYFGLIPGDKTRLSLDPDTARVAEVRISDPVPARIETPLGNFLCERVLVTTGAFGANIWLNPEGFLLRVEIPHFGLVAVRRGCYGFPGIRGRGVEAEEPALREIRVQNGRAQLAGSLYTPDGAGPFNTVLIISDSGAQDRNGNQPGTTLSWNHHRDWARAFRRAGVAVISPDDAGVGLSVPGRDEETISDSVLHGRALLAWARKEAALQGGKVGVLGHGEGSLVALQLLKNGDADFAVLIGAHGRMMGSIYLSQEEAEMRRQGVPEAVIKDKLVEDAEIQRLWLDTKIQLWAPPAVPEQFVHMGAPRAWFRDLMSFDVIKIAAEVKGPVFIIHGEADAQIPVTDGEALAKALTDAKKDVTFRKYPGLDHLLMKTINGEIGDSADPDRKVDPDAADEMAKWVKGR